MKQFLTEQTEQIEEYDESLVRRMIEKVTIYDDRFTVKFKSGKISKKGVPLAIYDTRGFELGKEVQAEVKQEVMDTISKGLATQDINKSVHCIWYCINTASNRIEPEEIEWLRELSMENQITQVPIIVVLTQSFSKKNAQKMRQILLNENLDIIQVIPVLAEDYEIEDLKCIFCLHIHTLNDITTRNENLRLRFLRYYVVLKPVRIFTH